MYDTTDTDLSQEEETMVEWALCISPGGTNQATHPPTWPHEICEGQARTAILTVNYILAKRARKSEEI